MLSFTLGSSGFAEIAHRSVDAQTQSVAADGAETMACHVLLFGYDKLSSICGMWLSTLCASLACIAASSLVRLTATRDSRAPQGNQPAIARLNADCLHMQPL